MAKILTKREEIAKALNFGKYPVLTIDIQNCVEGYEGLYHGSDVRVACKTLSHGTLYAHCTLSFCKDENGDGFKDFSLTQGGVCLKSSFGYSDIMDMAKWANTPIVHAGQEVVVILNLPNIKCALVKIMKVSSHTDLHCMTVATIDDIED